MIQDMVMEYMDEKHFNQSTNSRIAPIEDMDTPSFFKSRRSIMDFGS